MTAMMALRFFMVSLGWVAERYAEVVTWRWRSA
jgi:hypothetical protein